MRTTLNQIHAKSPSADVWGKLLGSLGKTQADDEPLSIVAILDSNGIGDALWCLRAVEGHDREIRLYAVWCARQAQHLMTDQRSLDALDVAERFANGLASAAEFTAAGDAALAAIVEGSAAWPWANAGGRARAVAWHAVRPEEDDVLGGMGQWMRQWLRYGMLQWMR